MIYAKGSTAGDIEAYLKEKEMQHTFMESEVTVSGFTLSPGLTTETVLLASLRQHGSGWWEGLACKNTLPCKHGSLR